MAEKFLIIYNQLPVGLQTAYRKKIWNIVKQEKRITQQEVENAISDYIGVVDKDLAILTKLYLNFLKRKNPTMWCVKAPDNKIRLTSQEFDFSTMRVLEADKWQSIISDANKKSYLLVNPSKIKNYKIPATDLDPKLQKELQSLLEEKLSNAFSLKEIVLKYTQVIDNDYIEYHHNDEDTTVTIVSSKKTLDKNDFEQLDELLFEEKNTPVLGTMLAKENSALEEVQIEEIEKIQNMMVTQIGGTYSIDREKASTEVENYNIKEILEYAESYYQKNQRLSKEIVKGTEYDLSILDETSRLEYNDEAKKKNKLLCIVYIEEGKLDGAIYDFNIYEHKIETKSKTDDFDIKKLHECHKQKNN